MSDKIISTFKLLGTIGGGYLGYKYGISLKDKIKKSYPSISDSYIEPFLKGSVINEDKAFSISGGLFGIMVGSQLWFITIPSSLVVLTNDYPYLKKFFE